MSKQSNIYDLVEHAAVRSEAPRLELWQSVAKALIEGELRALNLSSFMNPKVYPAMTFRDWFVGFRASVDRFNDPNSCAHILKHIIVRASDFERWLRKATRGRRGPGRGTTGYQDSDRKLFPRIRALIKRGHARGAYGAALQLFDEGKIAGNGSRTSRAKRLSKRYLREYAT